MLPRLLYDAGELEMLFCRGRLSHLAGVVES